MSSKTLINHSDSVWMACQDHVLVRASYRMDVQQKRLLTLGISKIDPVSMKLAEAHNNPPHFKVSVADWLRICPDETKPFRALRGAALNLLGARWARKVEGGIEEGNWFSTCRYIDDPGYVELKFTPETTVFLYQFAAPHIQARVDKIGKLKSFNQQRLYELFLQQSPRCGGSGWYIATFDDLQYSLGTRYEKFAELKRSVLDPGIKAINKKTDIEVSIKAVNRGKQRRVRNIEFFVADKTQHSFDF